MQHTMKLQPKPMQMIRNGIKTIELRLFDEKRQKVNIGDSILFINTENEQDTLKVKVKDIYTFESFEELYQNLPLLECGYTKEDIDSASPRDMEKYYSTEQQKKYGVVGFEIGLRDTDMKE